MDLLQPPEKIAAQMKERGIKADYAFFFAYIQPTPPEGGSLWSAVDELVKVNSACVWPTDAQYSNRLIQPIYFRISCKLWNRTARFLNASSFSWV